jgi:hypothetical protein
MGKKKAASKLAVSAAAAKGAAEVAKDRAQELQERLTPAVEEARERLAPRVVEARERLTPVVEDARERLTPVVDDARVRLAEIAETVATRLDDALPDDRTPAVVKNASANNKSGSGSGWFKKLLVLTGLGGLAFFVARRLRGGGGTEPQWQSTAPARPTPASSGAAATPTASEQAASAAPAATVAGLVSAEPDPSAEDAGGGTPEEIAADAEGSTGVATTPDDPAETVQLPKP